MIAGHLEPRRLVDVAQADRATCTALSLSALLGFR